MEEGLIEAKGSIQIGIRGPLADANDLKFVKDHGIRVLSMDDIRQRLNGGKKKYATADEFFFIEF